MQNEKSKFKKEFISRLVKFSVRNIEFAKELRKDRNLWPICDQVIRSSTSISANVVEAKASHSRRDYIKYFEIALKSANETKFWYLVMLEVINSSGQKKTCKNLMDELEEISKIIGSSVLTLKGKK